MEGYEEDCTSQGSQNSVPRASRRSGSAPINSNRTVRRLKSNEHLASAPALRLVLRGEGWPPHPQQPPQPSRGADQQPPPQPRGEDRQPPAVAQPPQPLRGADQQPHPQPHPPPPPHIVACFDLEHFKHHVPIFDHWNQHVRGVNSSCYKKEEPSILAGSAFSI